LTRDNVVELATAVEVLGAYSNPSVVSRLRRLLAGQDADRVSDRSSLIVSRRRKQAQVRLRSDEVAALVRAYQAGSTLGEVAAKFGVYVRTAAAHLEREDIPQRRHRLTPAHVSEAVRLYEAGWSTIQIGHHFGIYPQSVRYQLIKQGVTMRARPGRQG
jgi:hypothetical protein